MKPSFANTSLEPTPPSGTFAASATRFNSPTSKGRKLGHCPIFDGFARSRCARYNTRSDKMTQAQKSRREILEQFVATRPADAFARYGLAMECAKLGDDQAAVTNFQH